MRAKGRKRTKIVVVTRLSDVNPLLIGKLGAQCSCAEGVSTRRRRPGLRRVVSRVRVVRPKDGDVVSSTEGYASSTEGYASSSEDYASSTTEGRALSSSKQVELEEDLALIRDAIKSDPDDDDEVTGNEADFGAVVVSSTEGSSSAAYEQDELVSSTAPSRGRGRSRGRTTYVRAGQAKSTIYVSTTAEPDDDDEPSLSSSTSSSTVYEVTTASSRRAVGRRTTARSIQVNSKDEDDDKDAVVIKPRPRSRSRPSPRVRSRARSENDLAPAQPSPATGDAGDTGDYEATPGPGHTVDLGVNGVVECRRPGLFRHPELCNKFYSCNWDKWKKKYAVNIFNCPIHLAYDTTIGACNWPSKGPACVDGKLLV